MSKRPRQSAPNRGPGRRPGNDAPPQRRRAARTGRIGPIAGTVAVVLVIAGLTAFGLHRTSRGRAGAGTRVSYDTATKVLAFTLPAFHGGVVSTAALAGKPAVVNFYASWCEVCNAEMPDFEKAHQQLGDRVGFVGINPQQGGSDTDAGQAAMVARTGITYPTARDADNQLLAHFNTSGALPTTLLIDATGHVVDVHNGGLNQADLQALIARDLGVVG